MESNEYRNIIKKLNALKDEKYEDYVKSPDELYQLFSKVLTMPIDKQDLPEGEKSTAHTRMGALIHICTTLRLTITNDTDRKFYTPQVAASYANRIQRWFDQLAAERRSNRMVWAAWFSAACALVSVGALIWATLFNPGRAELLKDPLQVQIVSPDTPDPDGTTGPIP